MQILQKNEDLKDLGTRLRFYRKWRGYSQGQLSEKSGIHINHISKIETGKSNPSFLTLIALAKGLNTTIKKLVLCVD